MPRYSLTTWYYVFGADDALHSVPARVPEELLLGSKAKAGPPHLEWVRDFGGVILTGVIVGLHSRMPEVFVGMGSCLLSVRPECPKVLPQEHWERFDLASRLARTAGHRAKVKAEDVPKLADFLLYHVMNLPVVTARLKPFSKDTVLYYLTDSVNSGVRDRWMVSSGEMIPGRERT